MFRYQYDLEYWHPLSDENKVPWNDHEHGIIHY